VKGLEAEVQANSIAMSLSTSLRGRRLGWAMLIQLTSGRPLVVVCPAIRDGHVAFPSAELFTLR
jgi:hypothetical protein